MARLLETYREKLVPELTKRFGYKSVMEVPRITKITLNMGVGEAVADKKIMDNAVADLAKIAGQKPVVTKARKAIAGFKIREGYPIGCMVTLRGVRMYEFLDRLITVALPRVRDFRGVSGRSFDGRGNYNFGVKEQIMFPEIEYDKVDALRGLNISITTTARRSAKHWSRSTPPSAQHFRPSSMINPNPTRSAIRRVSPSRNNRAQPVPRACASAAPSRVVRAACSASSAWAATSCVNSPCEVKSPV